mmetsp:Transcript_15691/g.51342  ORF Transcript_15691/g.51342 Transcript_15691/m.51342 type:complete len:217 (-) Transcript_15691:922-1572(-)
MGRPNRGAPRGMNASRRSRCSASWRRLRASRRSTSRSSSTTTPASRHAPSSSSAPRDCWSRRHRSRCGPRLIPGWVLRRLRSLLWPTRRSSFDVVIRTTQPRRSSTTRHLHLRRPRPRQFLPWTRRRTIRRQRFQAERRWRGAPSSCTTWPSRSIRRPDIIGTQAWYRPSSSATTSRTTTDRSRGGRGGSGPSGAGLGFLGTSAGARTSPAKTPAC